MNTKQSVFSKWMYLLLAAILIISVFLGGCSGQNNIVSTDGNTIAEETIASGNEPAAVSERNLTITLTVDQDSSVNAAFSCEELGGNFTEGLRYWDVTDVSIEIDGTTMKLETALQEGLISEEDIFYYARLDAANGICQETCESTKGLNNFTYAYPEYDLRIIYDVLETPDGQQRLISDMGIYPPESNRSPYYNFFDSKTGERYIVEDWGLDFQVKSVSPTGISVICTQFEGQQIGQLYVTNYTLITPDGKNVRTDGEDNAVPYADGAVQMNGTTEICIDWTEYCGELPIGNYILELAVEDRFDETQVHPLMTDYYDNWYYRIEFSIP